MSDSPVVPASKSPAAPAKVERSVLRVVSQGPDQYRVHFTDGKFEDMPRKRFAKLYVPKIKSDEDE
jgi:hypothetical protein